MVSGSQGTHPRGHVLTLFHTPQQSWELSSETLDSHVIRESVMLSLKLDLASTLRQICESEVNSTKRVETLSNCGVWSWLAGGPQSMGGEGACLTEKVNCAQACIRPS